MRRDYIETSFGRISYLYKNGKKVILLLHGLGGMGNNFLKLSSCSGDEFGFILPDLLGHGRSQKMHKLSVDIQAKSIFEMIEKLGLENFIIGGHSYGGWVSLYMESRMDTKSEKIILIDSAGVSPGVGETGKGDFMLERVMNMNPKNDPEIIREIILENSNEIYKIKDEDLSKINKKTLIIWGERDKLIPPIYGKIMAEKIKQSKFVIIKDAGHTPLQDNLEYVCHSISDFLNWK
ncbi:alpha/beta fold hydrolase [Caldiplasma sukawensis]